MSLASTCLSDQTAGGHGQAGLPAVADPGHVEAGQVERPLAARVGHEPVDLADVGGREVPWPGSTDDEEATQHPGAQRGRQGGQRRDRRFRLGGEGGQRLGRERVEVVGVCPQEVGAAGQGLGDAGTEVGGEVGKGSTGCLLYTSDAADE